LIEIGSHSLSHPFLANLDDDAAEREITVSRERLQEQLDTPIRYFCYPAGNFSEREVRLVAAAGYLGAVSVRPGSNRRGQSPFALNRTEVTDDDSAADLLAKLDGAYDLPHSILHWRRLRQFGKLRQRCADDRQRPRMEP
jgi:peptidoglycan/xylan/chitin deacetylase (PgdA/CDA1 family)